MKSKISEKEILRPYLENGYVKVPVGHQTKGWFTGNCIWSKDDNINDINLEMKDYMHKKYVLTYVEKVNGGFPLVNVIMNASYQGKKEVINFFEKLYDDMDPIRIKSFNNQMLNLFRLWFTGEKELALTILNGFSKNKKRRFKRSFDLNNKERLDEQFYHYVTYKLYRRTGIVLAGENNKSYKMIVSKFSEFFNEQELNLLHLIMSYE